MPNNTDNTNEHTHDCSVNMIDSQLHPKKKKKKSLPRSVENGCVIVDDSITEEDLAAIRLTD